jgi:ABC-2 type transport system ATP-binding protein
LGYGRKTLSDNEVIVQDLTKIYPRVKAVDGLSFAIQKEEIFGLLGPNGAGKTTTIRMFLTLVKPTSGTINLFGVDALTQPNLARQMAGYVPQEVSVDGDLTGYENILMYSKLYGVPSKERKERIKKLLTYLDLMDRADNMVKTYSGGMMRRLEMAQALVNQPRILFLDEPSIGLDPNARHIILGLIKRLRDEFGTTILITTHDMSEADLLCDRVGIMDKGKLIIVGEPAQLKRMVGGDILTIYSKTPVCLARLKELGYADISESSDGHFDLVVSNGESLIPHLLDTLRMKGVQVDAVSLKEPTLDDVFLKNTGARIEEGNTWVETRRARRTIGRLTK